MNNIEFKDVEQKIEELTEKKDNKSKAYRNPSKTLAGKIIIIILALVMAFGGLFSLIYAIAQNF